MIEARFRAKFVAGTPDECWPWLAAKSAGGYGQISENGRLLYAHRVALALHLGREIAEGLVVRHSCDNRACVNPAHLVEGTVAENNRDMSLRNRVNRPRLTWEKVRQIRQRLSSGEAKKALAREFGVYPTTIRRIANNDIWREAEA